MDLYTNNKPDRFCRSHNLRSSELDNQKCDKKMISDLKQVKPSLVEEAVNKKIVQDVIGVKKTRTRSK